jgi:hypothetical protein
MEADIALQKTKEATQVERLQALRVKFSTVAQIKFGSKEKGVSWSLQESKFGPLSPGDSTAFTPPNPTPAVLVRGAKYRRSSNLDKLTTQLNKQVRLAATASAFATSLQSHRRSFWFCPRNFNSHIAKSLIVSSVYTACYVPSLTLRSMQGK